MAGGCGIYIASLKKIMNWIHELGESNGKISFKINFMRNNQLLFELL